RERQQRQYRSPTLARDGAETEPGGLWDPRPALPRAAWAHTAWACTDAIGGHRLKDSDGCAGPHWRDRRQHGDTKPEAQAHQHHPRRDLEWSHVQCDHTAGQQAGELMPTDTAQSEAECGADHAIAEHREQIPA